MGRVFDMNLDLKCSNQTPHLTPGYLWMPKIVSKMPCKHHCLHAIFDSNMFENSLNGVKVRLMVGDKSTICVWPPSHHCGLRLSGAYGNIRPQVPQAQHK